MGTTREQLRARRSDDKERHVGGPVDKGIDEVEQAVVGPVQILEDENGCALRGKSLEEAAPRRECLDAPVPAGSIVGDSDEGMQHRSQPLDLSLAAQACDGLKELRLRDRSGVALEDPGLRLDHLTQRPVAHALAIRK